MRGSVNNKVKALKTVNTVVSKIPKTPSSTPKKNDESSEKLPTYSDCILSTTIFA